MLSPELGADMRRREFLGVLGGAAAWPLAAHAQQGERTRRVGLLMGYPQGDAEGQAMLAGLQRGLRDLGWTEGRNLRIEAHWVGGDPNKARIVAKELIATTPDVIVPSTNMVVGIVQEETHTIPVIFLFVGDPVLSGYVSSLALPGGNMTGFAALEQSVGGKWVELLKEIVPNLRNLGVIVHLETPANVGLLAQSRGRRTGARRQGDCTRSAQRGRDRTRGFEFRERARRRPHRAAARRDLWKSRPHPRSGGALSPAGRISCW